MRFAAAFVLLVISVRPAVAGPICAGATATVDGEERDVAPFCVEAVPLATRCRSNELEVVGTGVSGAALVCLPS